MATTATLTINAEDIIGADFDKSRASVWVEANTEHGLIVVDGTNVRVGGRRENLVDGVATFNLVTTNSADNPASFGYRVTIVYVPKGSRKQGHDTITTSDFPFTASANLAAIDEAWDNVTAPVSWRSDFRDEMEALRDEAAAIAAGDISAQINTAVANKADVGRVSTLPTAAATARTYDAQHNLYNLKPAHLRKYRAALGKAIGGTGLASIACLGTSIAAGQGAAPGSTSYPVRLRQFLAAMGVPVAGTGVVPCHHGDSGLTDARWSFTGTWSKFNPGTTTRTILFQTGGTATATFASDLPGTVARVHYSNLSGPFTVAIDGGSAVTVTPPGGTTIGTYQVTGLADTTHSIVITRTSGVLYLAGAGVRKTTGLEVHNVGMGGTTLSEMSVGAADYSTTYFTRNVLVPSLVLLNAMTNEAYNSISAATYKSNLDGTVAQLQGAGIPVVLIAEIPAGGNTAAAQPMNLTAYRTALYEVAITRDVPVIDLFERWGSYTEANTNGLMTDTFHPNAAGYGDYANAVARAIA